MGYAPIIFDGIAVESVKELKLLGVMIDSQLLHSSQIQSLTLGARKRIGLLRRTAKVLNGNGRAIVYKAFVRPRMEYAHLTWMGAADSHLWKLDAVQNAAVAIIGPDVAALDSLNHRRKVGALTYMYKLQSWDVPPHLQRMIPPRMPQAARGRTRASIDAHQKWHGAMLSNPLPLRSTDNARRAFPYGILKDWNQLPADFFSDEFRLENVPKFKSKVNQFLKQPSQFPAIPH